MDKETVLHIHSEIYSATKKNEIMASAGKRVELEIIVLNEISQMQKDKNDLFSLIHGYQVLIHIQILYMYMLCVEGMLMEYL